MDTKKTKEPSDIEKAKQLLEEIDLEKDREDNGWVVEFDTGFSAKPKEPKVTFMKRPTVGDGIVASRDAKLAFGLGVTDIVTPEMNVVCKLSRIARFDGESWDPIQIQELSENFFNHLAATLVRSTI